jgi:ornithine carbamoyltransferase
MLKLTTKHLLTGAELSGAELLDLLDIAYGLKQNRHPYTQLTHLSGQHLALLFDKPSLRTRFSFTVAMRELGGDVIESTQASRKQETPEDYANVLSGYCHGIVVRTHDDETLERMQAVSQVPVINGLSEHYHPCQILADLLTLYEIFGDLNGLTVSYIGDGNNILHSLLLMAPKVGVHVHFSCPAGHGPKPEILQLAQQQCHSRRGDITAFADPKDAVANADAIYTDVWTSMGCTDVSKDTFAGFQVNEALKMLAKPNAVVMHCLPMVRGEEISEEITKQPYAVMYQQSENRLHAQKALLLALLEKKPVSKYVSSYHSVSSVVNF